MIQQNTFDIMTACNEIERSLLGQIKGVPGSVEQAVKKSGDTEHLLERYKKFSEFESRAVGKYTRLKENFSKAKSKLEDTLRRLSEKRAAHFDSEKSTQLQVLGDVREESPLYMKKPSPGYDYISSMEEGVRGQTLQDLTRMSKDMNSLQDIYFSLSEVASSHSSFLDSVQDRLVQASNSASSAVIELTRASGRMDKWTKVKIYTFTGCATVGLLFWIL